MAQVGLGQRLAKRRKRTVAIAADRDANGGHGL